MILMPGVSILTNPSLFMKVDTFVNWLGLSWGLRPPAQYG